MSKEKATYSHTHHASVVNDHARRTAVDSAAYLLPHLSSLPPNATILDIGCGPGTITCDFAALLAPQSGTIIGLDSVDSVLTTARTNAQSRNLSNISFQTGDANALPFPDDMFDVVHCHQLLQHVADPIGVLSEMRRVTKPGGLVAAREADYAGFVFYPSPAELERWRGLYADVARKNGGEPNAGRFLHVWARKAGFQISEIETTWDTWRYSGERARLFGESWSGRILQVGFKGTAVREGLSSDEEIGVISEAWKHWGRDQEAFIAIPHGEVICWKGS